MVCENYIQHNLKVPTGRAAFIAMIPKLKKHGSKIENIRMLQDGKHIIMHHKWSNALPFGFNETAAFHIIRFDNDNLISEHWNVMTNLGKPNTSGRTLIDGKKEIKDTEKTEENKSIIKELIKNYITLDKSGIVKIIPLFFEKNFHQHNENFSDGIENIIENIIEETKFPHYQEQHAVFGEGNFILSISEGIYLKKNSALYDLFMLEEGKIVAQWNIYQEIPTENLANQNTMFDF